MNQETHRRARSPRVVHWRSLAVCLALVSSACSSTLMRVQKGSAAKMQARWAVLPFANHSETPQAGERVEATVDTLLRARGIGSLEGYPAPKGDDGHLTTSDRARYDDALAWARKEKIDLVVTGSVEEWRYKSGLEGEPAVGITVKVIELGSGKVVWSATGTKTGRASENVSGTALGLLDVMVQSLDLSP